MLISAVVFAVMGEPGTESAARRTTTFAAYLREGAQTFAGDRRFRLFVFAQWSSGAVLLAMPFYVVQAFESSFQVADVAWLLGAQTAGALASNALWGWWGDRLGKSSLLHVIAFARMVPPCLILLVAFLGDMPAPALIGVYLCAFFILGALANGLTIAVIGFLMEISPADRRPSYSGYFNALTAPAFLFPLLGGAIASVAGLSVVFVISLIAAAMQFMCVGRIRAIPQASDTGA